MKINLQEIVTNCFAKYFGKLLFAKKKLY